VAKWAQCSAEELESGWNGKKIELCVKCFCGQLVKHLASGRGKAKCWAEWEI